MADLIDILRDWYEETKNTNETEAVFVKQIIDEISSLRYLNQNSGSQLTVKDWEQIEKMVSFSTHRKHCANIYNNNRCTCGFFKVAEEYEKLRNPQKDSETPTTEKA